MLTASTPTSVSQLTSAAPDASAQPDAGSARTDRAALLRLPPLRANRVLRRDFCAPNGPGPLPGADSELVFAYRSLLDATTTAHITELCLVRRIQRDPRVPVSARRCDPALVKSFEELLTRVQDDPVLARLVLERMVRTVLDELARPGGASRSETTAFFRAAADSCGRWRRLTAGGLPGLGGLRARGVLTGSRPAFLAGRALDQGRKRLRQSRELGTEFLRRQVQMLDLQLRMRLLPAGHDFPADGAAGGVVTEDA